MLHVWITLSEMYDAWLFEPERQGRCSVICSSRVKQRGFKYGEHTLHQPRGVAFTAGMRTTI